MFFTGGPADLLVTAVQTPWLSATNRWAITVGNPAKLLIYEERPGHYLYGQTFPGDPTRSTGLDQIQRPMLSTPPDHIKRVCTVLMNTGRTVRCDFHLLMSLGGALVLATELNASEHS